MGDFKTIVIDCLRHGCCEGPQQTLRGRTDVALTREGRLAMLETAGRVGTPDRVITSPLRRCLEAAETLATQWRARPLVLDEIREMDFGDWDGVPTETLLTHDRDRLERFQQDPSEQTPPGGERYDAFLSRTASGWQALLRCGLEVSQRESGDKRSPDVAHLLVCGHAGVIKSWAAASLGLSTVGAQHLYKLHLPYAGLMRFRVDIHRHSGERYEQLRFAGVPRHPLRIDE